mmetsp:Transcript_24907/g.58457  ORF Transcript_24907/g.58457 Transcript_24907/m.58457 type:complete len:208 (-) Transcript_24907:59-682(-)
MASFSTTIPLQTEAPSPHHEGPAGLAPSCRTARTSDPWPSPHCPALRREGAAAARRRWQPAPSWVRQENGGRPSEPCRRGRELCQARVFPVPVHSPRGASGSPAPSTPRKSSLSPLARQAAAPAWRPGLVARFGPQPHLPERPPDAPLASRLSGLSVVPPHRKPPCRARPARPLASRPEAHLDSTEQSGCRLLRTSGISVWQTTWAA